MLDFVNYVDSCQLHLVGFGLLVIPAYVMWIYQNVLLYCLLIGFIRRKHEKHFRGTH